MVINHLLNGMILQATMISPYPHHPSNWYLRKILVDFYGKSIRRYTIYHSSHGSYHLHFRFSKKVHFPSNFRGNPEIFTNITPGPLISPDHNKMQPPNNSGLRNNRLKTLPGYWWLIITQPIPSLKLTVKAAETGNRSFQKETKIVFQPSPTLPKTNKHSPQKWWFPSPESPFPGGLHSQVLSLLVSGRGPTSCRKGSNPWVPNWNRTWVASLNIMDPNF